MIPAKSNLIITIWACALLVTASYECQGQENGKTEQSNITPVVTSKWSLRIGMGASAITHPDGSEVPNGSQIYPSPSFALSVIRRLSARLDVGLQLQATGLARKADVVLYQQFYPVGTYQDARLHIGKTALMFLPFASYRFGHFYVGAQLGYFTSIDGANGFSGNHARIYYNDYKGFMGGLHVGNNWVLGKKFGLYAEAQANFLDGTKKMNGFAAYGIECIQGGLLLGGKYSF